ncbi:MAG: alpha/beta fold hydrolase [Candidatus Sulfotelmatobacter sp.]
MNLGMTLIVVLACVIGASVLLFFILFFFRPIAMTRWLRTLALWRAGARKTKVKTAIGDQSIWQAGSGPTLVLLHGAGDQAGTWYNVAPALKPHFHLLMPDLAGHGQSAPATGILSLGTLLTALEQVLDAVSTNDSKFVLIGNSLGAWMSMLYADKHPRRVSRVILIGGGPIKGVSEIGLMPKNREEARRALDAVLDPSTPRRPNFVLDDLVRFTNHGPISRLIAAGDEDIAKYLLDGKLATFEVPVDLVWGASDRLVPLDYARKLQSQLPRCTLTVIDRTGHAPQLERPHALAKLLLQILGQPA